MNLYIIRNVLYDYSSGMVIFKAKALEDVREMFCKSFVEPLGFGYDEDDDDPRGLRAEFDTAIKNKDYTVLTLAEDDIHPEGHVASIYGGG